MAPSENKGVFFRSLTKKKTKKSAFSMPNLFEKPITSLPSQSKSPSAVEGGGWAGRTGPLYVELGRVARPHGLEGGVFVCLFSSVSSSSFVVRAESASVLKLCELVTGQTVQIQGRAGDFSARVERADPHKGGMIIQIEGVRDRQKAQSLRGALLLAPKGLFSSSAGESIYLCEVLRFTVRDQKRGVLGQVCAFSHNGAQDLLLVKRGEADVEIPFIKEFITHIDFKLGEVKVNLPFDWPGLDY